MAWRKSMFIFGIDLVVVYFYFQNVLEIVLHCSKESGRNKSKIESTHG